MDELDHIIFGVLFVVTGVLLIKQKNRIGNKSAILYKKLGINVPQDLYAKQFGFIGVLLVVVGVLTGAGLLKFL